ncbi:unnamed protein product [Cuscuta campestris]|uniref:Uncharacterized protein n=1 Tax=Cuscuta campestris TaxID=132261 RepID=A0A484M069_9ASTE|nr:unnamed protein product [Cuscuta campestris]
MSEPPKVRLVRCPNCANLLPEVTGFSVYQCGGCGVVLRAKKKIEGLEKFPDKSGEEGELGISERFEKVENLSDSSEIDVKSNAGSSSAMSERRVESYKSKISGEQIQEKNGEPLQNLIPECGSENELQRPDRCVGRRWGEARISASPNRGRIFDIDASSSYELGCDYGYQPLQRRGDRGGSSKVEYAEDDRAELMRKLEDLKEQLSRSCQIVDNPKDRLPLDRKIVYQDHPYGGSHDRFGSAQYPAAGRHKILPGHGFYPQSFGFQPYGPVFNPPPPHHPSCSCFHCYNTSQNVVRVLPPAIGIDRFHDVSHKNPYFYDHDHLGRSGLHNYDPRISGPLPIRKRALKPSGLRCLPVAGAAPFLVCHSCLELLHLSNKRAFLRDNQQMKVKCGACSCVMDFEVRNMRLVPIHGQVNKNSDMFASSDDNMTGDPMNRPVTVFSSEDFDNSGYDFHAMDQDRRSMEGRTRHSKSSSMNAEDISSTELSLKEKVSPPPPPPPVGSPLQDHFDYSTKYGNANRFKIGNGSGPSSPEKMRSKKKTLSSQSSMKDVPVASEMDISSNEYANTGSSLESGESSMGDQTNSNKPNGSFFAIAKKSFKSNKQVVLGEKRGDVIVNGHRISDELVKKAERSAGKISPGQYWYDFRAGFWGVMGGPCLGIIPPFIEEFNYPMPENCTGGNTGVFVNGRELHDKDLQLLCSRGLPDLKGRSYIIEISGRVLDEDTGKELESLGKLAPTVERMKCGFGMKVPKNAT